MAMYDDLEEKTPLFWYLVILAITLLLHFSMQVHFVAAFLFGVAVSNFISGFLELLPVRPLKLFPGKALFKVAFGIVLLLGMIAYYRGPLH